jgi:hypothetical protein
MKLIIASTAIALGMSFSAHAAEPAVDHSQHQQHQQRPQSSTQTPRQAPGGSSQQTPPAPEGQMQHHNGMHQGMKMEDCCCKKAGEPASKPMACADKAGAAEAPTHDHNSH